MSLVPCLLIAFSLTACGKHPKSADAAGSKKKEKKDDLPKAVGFGEVETTVYQSADPKAPISFTVGGTAGNLHLANGTVETGKLENPHGHIFQNGKPTSTYRADTGDAVRAIKRLNMRDHVQLQSIDKTQTLTSNQGEYRGDVKLVRAMGNVVATGPFGTLSGLPELWATPDLKLIGTPDMVAKTLKIPALATLAATAAIASPQLVKGRDYRIENAVSVGAENLNAQGQRLTAVPVKGKSLLITMSSRNMTIQSAGPVVILLEPKGREVRHMTSQGAAHVVQTSDAGTTTMDGDGSTYDAPAGADVGTLDVGGRVTLSSVTRRKDAKGAVSTQTTVSKGDRGRAMLLAKPPKDGDALKEAILTGNVVIDSKGSSNDGTFNGVGDRLVYTPRGAVADVDLTGSVVLTNTKTGKDEAGKPTTQTTVSRGRSAHAVIDPQAGNGADPLKNATITGGTVSIDVSGDEGTFKGTGDKVVYTATGGGNGQAVMTGNLKFSGDAPDYLSDIANADTAVLTIGRTGWKTVHLENSGGEATTTTIQTKTPPTVKKPEPGKGGKKKKGGKG